MTDYLRLAQERAPQATEEQDNPYLSVAKETQQLQQNRARTVIESALKDDPEIAAERLRLSQTSGLPPDVVQRNLDELRVKERARAIDLVNMAQESPILYRQLVDPTFTTTSVDDLDTLKNIEKAIGKTTSYVMGADGKGGLVSDIGGAAVDVGLGATAGVGELIFNATGAVYDLIGWRTGARDMRYFANRSKEARQDFGLQAETSTGQAVKSGVQSAGTNLAILPLGLSRSLFATAGEAASAVAGILAAGVGADSYLTAREKGLGVPQALTYAVPQAGFEYLFEKIPASKLFGDIAANTGLLKTLGKQAVSEGWTEQVTTLAQDFNDWMNLNPEKSLGQFIQERPEAAYQTFIATLVGVGVQTTTIKGINKVIEKASNQALVFEQDALAGQMALASQSLLRQRSPEQFRAHVQQVVDANDGAKKEIYVDGEVLNQLPQELLAQLPESVREQIPAALETNSTVSIPMADVLTLAPGTEMERIINDNARMRPNSASRVEAQLAAEMIQQEADRVMQQAADQSAWQQSTEAVKTTILDQLNTAGRFTPDVNEAYSTLVRDFYSVTANRLGITPEEMYQRYPLRVGAAGQQGQGGVLEDEGSLRQAYGNAPDNLMGLSKGKPQKAFGEQGYKFVQYVEVTTSDGTTHVDAIAGLNAAHAMERARRSWSDATVTALTEAQAVERDPTIAQDVAAALTRSSQALNQSPAFDGTDTGNTPIGDATEIEVDGQMRPALNSTGKPIHPTQEGIRNFWRWFGDSKVVDAEGKPLVVYHGTTKNFDVFDASKSKTTGIFFAAYPDYANIVAELDGAREGGGAVVPAYLRIENPATVLSREFSRADTKNAKSNGRDGLITFDDQGKPSQLTVFSGDQIKSATGNTGAFNPADASVLNQQARGTFNPQQLLITLNENADLSTFLHESGHFFLEVMADLASQPNAPAEVQEDMGQLLKWFGIRGDEIVGGVNSGAPLAQGGAANDYDTQLPAIKQFKDLKLKRYTEDEKVQADSAYADEPSFFLKGVREVQLSELILPNENFYTSPAEEARIRDLADQIKKNGKITPVLVVEGTQSKTLRLAEGQHRARALRLLGYSSVPALVALPREHAYKKPGAFAQGGDAPVDNTQPAGRTPLEVWNAMTLDQKRPHHERFAESFEQYLLEGKAPNQELQPLFRRFRSWLVNVYKSLSDFMRGRDLRLSDEVRQVFDRMLATDEQIRQAEEAAGMLPDFDATNEAIEKLQSRSLRDLKWTVNARNKAIKALQKDAATLRKGVQEEVRAEVEQQPVYRAINFLRYGKLVQEGMSNTERKALDKAAGMNVKLDLPALKEMYGDGPAAPWRYLSTGKTGLAASEGVHPDIVADMLGFESGDDLVRQILAAEDINSVVEGITDQRMLERHGDLATPEAIEQAANEAVHNEARARSLATELKAQSEMMNQRQDTGRTDVRGRSITVNAITTAAKEFAQNLAARRRVKDLRKAAWQHRSAEARAGKAWQAATAKGDTQAAVQAKRDQLLNNYSAKALQEAQAEARKILEFFGKITKGNNEKLVKGGRDPDVVNAMRAILAAYGIAPRTGKSALEYLDVLQSNDPSMYAALQPSIAGAMNNAKPVDELTMEELRGLRDEIDAMWHLAKRSRQIEVDGNLLDIEDAAEELQARMQEIGVPLAIPGEGKAITKKEERARKLQHFGSLLRRAEQWAEGMDGSFGGPFLRLVFQPVKEAANRYRADRVKYRKTYQALIDQVAPTLTKGKIDAPEIGYTFGEGHNGIGHAELLHAILHTGNASNKRKLLLGRKWASENADGTLDTSRWDAFIQRMHDTGVLNKTHYDFAQGVWDLLEQTKPLAQKTHRDVFGRYFAEVTADSFETPFGSYRGGYVPAQADPRIVQDADLRKLAELENENMAYSFPSTNRGFTNTRVEYNHPLMLDLRTIGQHIDKVLLFSHMEPSVRDVNKLLSQKGVAYSLGRIDPTIYAGMLTPWLSRAARQIVETPAVGDGGLSRILSTARSRSGMALMIANVSNALQQVTGFFPAFAKLKSDGLNSHMMRATAQYISNPKEMARNVADASQFMENRMENEIAAMNDAMDQILLDPNLYEKAQAWTQKHAYFMQTAMANTMEPIIWTAGYNGALEKGMSEKDAVRYADGLIRQTQGSTLPEDVSQFETGSALKRMFVQFMGYFNMQANTNATGLKQIAQSVGLRKGAGKALLLVTVGPLASIWVAEAIAQAMRGGPDDEDDDGYLDDWLAAVFGFGTIKGALAMVPGVNIVGQAVLNRFNSNPADDKFSLSPAVSLLESAASSPFSVYEAIANDGSKRKAVRDVGALVSMATGLPAVAVARPLGYLAGVADDRIEPTGPVDAVRGLVTGTASPESKNP